MSQAIGYLERFNRKERFILLSHVLGQRAHIFPHFKLQMTENTSR